MEVGYKKDLNHNYMVINYPEVKDTQLYCVKMLYNNVIPGVINLELRNIDNKIMYYYDISGRQSLINLFIKTAVSYDKVKELISGIIEAIDKSYEYLLEEDDFVLLPEHIYMDISTGLVSLCYLPGYEKDIKGQLCSLIEYIMNRIDYNDKEAVMLVYDLYAAAREEGYTFAHMKDILYKNIHNQVKDNQPALEEIKPQNMEINSGIRLNKVLPSALEEVPVMMEKITDEREILIYPLKTYIGTGAGILGGILLLILGFVTKIIYNPLGTHINTGKLAALLLIITCVNAYFIKLLWDKKNKVAKIITKEEYIDPRTDISCNSICEQNKTSKPEDILSKLKSKFNNLGNTPTVLKENSLTPKNTNSEAWDTRAKSNITGYESMKILCDKLPSANINKIEDEEKYYTRLINSKITISSHSMLRPVNKPMYEDINITDFPFFIGKLKKNVDYCIDKDVVSRYHVKITKEEGKHYITDLNSTNGTFVNNEQLQTYQAQEIKDGDEISLADIKFVFVCMG